MKRLVTSLVVAILATLVGGFLGAAPASADIVPTPTTINVGDSVTIAGSEFTPGADLTVSAADSFGDGWSHSPFSGVTPDAQGNFTLTLGDQFTPFRSPGTWTITISDGTNTFTTTVEVLADDTHGATFTDVTTTDCTVSASFNTSGTGTFTARLQGGGEAGDYEGAAASTTASASPQSHTVTLAPIDWPGWNPQAPDTYYLYLRIYDPNGEVVGVHDTWSFDAEACPAVAPPTTLAPTTTAAPGTTDPGSTDAPTTTDGPTVTTSPAPTTATAATGGSATQLPETGSSTTVAVIVVGVLMTLGGAVLVFWSRRSVAA